MYTIGYGAELPEADAYPDEVAVAVFDPDTELEEDEDAEHAMLASVHVGLTAAQGSATYSRNQPLDKLF